MSHSETWPETSLLQFYLGFFGDRKFQFIDLLPVESEHAKTSHIPLDERFTAQQGLTEQQIIEEMDSYKHVCWCNPELIYADDFRGNEVWLHKPIQ